MLGIKDDRGKWIEWHINEPVPQLEGQVIEFQADGDELNFLLACMQKVRAEKDTGNLYSARFYEII